jgi:hypothetical protein
MKIERRKLVAAGWILLPALGASTVPTLTFMLTDNWIAGLAAAIPAALAAAWWIERRLRSVVDAIALIASGDRYAAAPWPTSPRPPNGCASR